MTGSAFAIEGDIIVWVVITDLQRDLEGQHGRSTRYLAEDSSNITYPWAGRRVFN